MQFQRVFGFIFNAIELGEKKGQFRKDLDSQKLTMAFWGTAIGIHALSVKLHGQVTSIDAESVSEEYLKTIPYGMILRKLER